MNNDNDDKKKEQVYITDNPEALKRFKKEGVVFVAQTEKESKHSDYTTVTRDGVTIFPNKGIKIEAKGDDVTIIMPDGTKQVVDSKTSKELIKNGVESDFMPVKGTREITEYEKKDKLKKALATGIALVIAIPIILNRGLKNCEMKEYQL